MTARQRNRPVVRSKVMPPPIPDDLLVRHRLVDRLSTDARVVLVASLPGYGKTVAARQWVAAVEIPTAWMSVDLLDGEPVSFWSHLLAAIGSACPGVDREPALLLHERGADDPLFLVSLVSQLEDTSHPAAVVLDGLDEHLGRSVYDGLATLIERTGHVLRFVITSRTNPPLPLARWRALGWLEEIREDELRLADDEASEIASRFELTVPTASAEGAVALNRRVHGWPIGFHMALMAGGRPADGTQFAGDDDLPEHLLADYLVAEVLAAMSEPERQTALRLSVLDWFDPAICDALVGPGSMKTVTNLLGRGIFLTVVDQRTGAMRFHALFRELLEMELGRRDPLERIELHQRAAMLWRERGNLTAAFRHLSAIGEIGTAHELLVGPALDLVDRGDLDALRRYSTHLPALRDVDDPNLALDLAVISFYGSGTQPASRWCDRAEVLINTFDVEAEFLGDDERTDLGQRLRDLRCSIALLDARLDTALEYIAAPQPPRRAGDQRVFEQRFPILAARVMLASRRREASQWIQLARVIPGPPIITSVTVPTLLAWNEWLFGRLDVAIETVDTALTWMDDHDVGAHHLAFDTLITAGWCHLSVGDGARVAELVRRATGDADQLGCVWNHVQAGFLNARLAVVTGDPAEALRLVDQLRSIVPFERCRPYSDRLLGLEVEALAGVGALDAARAALDSLGQSPQTQILRARFAAVGVDERNVLLADRDDWTVSERLQAELLTAVRGNPVQVTPQILELLASAAQSRWVLPFIGLGTDVDRLLQSDAVRQVHPHLARTIADVAPTGAPQRVGGLHLTARELTLLELLPTHLSYAEMGERLFLSVNTVKTNLKTLYRKLGANTRSQAVEAGRQAGVIQPT